jgi:hypothetical protein
MWRTAPVAAEVECKWDELAKERLAKLMVFASFNERAGFFIGSVLMDRADSIKL